ncbi:MAG: glutamate-1-semialdehyde 2,1-aminomutase [Tannerellaceae bacterium]|jgi:glutamate-1-semialdehyde 2,1-aminomutase|nr:glutamate-1-semialdehyde 2,1-aminomutase [Tannerellaceae bacterium]
MAESPPPASAAMMNRSNSIKAYEEALRYIPGGVNSPVRTLRSVEESPLFIQKAKAASLTDLDGNRFTDFCLSWGVFILGHAHPSVNKAIRKAVSKGTSYGIPSPAETALACLVQEHFPGMEKIRFVNSGTEAVMSAIRLARGATGRSTILKFDGCYHGHADHLLVSAGSGVAGLREASSAGVPRAFTEHTLSVPFNNTEAVEQVFREKGENIAAIIVEPVPANMGVILPQTGFLERLRELATAYRSLLIFDEVITGFRLPGGAQKYFGIKPDLTTLGKILGGGFPAAAFGGREDIMAFLAPDGPVYQAGTLSGNPVAMHAGIATLTLLSQAGYYEHLEKKARDFFTELSEIIPEKDIRLNSIGSLFTLFFTKEEVHSFADAQKAGAKRFKQFFKYMLAHHFYMSPSPFEANFLSSAHTKRELSRFLEAVKNFHE